MRRVASIIAVFSVFVTDDLRTSTPTGPMSPLRRPSGALGKNERDRKIANGNKFPGAGNLTANFSVSSDKSTDSAQNPQISVEGHCTKRRECREFPRNELCFRDLQLKIRKPQELPQGISSKFRPLPWSSGFGETEKTATYAIFSFPCPSFAVEHVFNGTTPNPASYADERRCYGCTQISRLPYLRVLCVLRG